MLFKKLIIKEFVVEGIHCDKCKAKVENALRSIDGVKKVSADTASGETIIKSLKPVDEAVIREKLIEEGFNPVFD